MAMRIEANRTPKKVLHDGTISHPHAVRLGPHIRRKTKLRIVHLRHPSQHACISTSFSSRSAPETTMRIYGRESCHEKSKCNIELGKSVMATPVSNQCIQGR